MSDVFRVRFITDVCYTTKSGKPLSSPELTMMSKRGGTYFRVGAIEGLEGKVDVLLEEAGDHKHQTAHHHSALDGNRCRICLEASLDGLGPE